MCFHGTLREIEVIGGKSIIVDACIADEIVQLNAAGVKTVGCCCGHGQAGNIIEYSNEFGKWKEYGQPPQALIKVSSKGAAIKMGYRPYPYFYADGSLSEILILPLKTGCLTREECETFNYDYPVSCEL